MGITTTIPTNLDFPHRGELERDDFVLAQEIAQDLLSGGYTTALNQYATELNETEDDINTKWEQVQSQAVDGGYSQAYIDGNFVNKAINSLTSKTTPVDADLLYLGDSVSSFSLKKLTWANIKSFFVQLAGNQTIDGIKTFTSSPIVPTLTSQDNSTKVATTAYVDSKFIRGTVVASTSGTSIDFTGIPSWAKRITVMFNGVSTSGTSFVKLQVGYTTISTSGYLSSSCLVYGSNQTLTAAATSGFVIAMNSSGDLRTGSLVLNNISANGYILSGSVGSENTVSTSNGYVSLSGTLDRVRITTANGTDTFDAGSINILYEG